MTLYPAPWQRRSRRRSWLGMLETVGVWLLIVAALVMSLVAVSLAVVG